MSDQELRSPRTPTPATAPRPAPGRRLTFLLLCGAVAGVLTGAVWELVWTPPTGAVWKDEWLLDPDGLTREVSSTGWFVVVGLVVGIAYGTLAAVLSRDRELVTLVGVVLGSLLLTWVALQVGHRLGPEDPRVLAVGMGDWEPLPSDLTLGGVENRLLPWGSTALVAPGVGALLGMIGIFLGGDGGRRRRRRDRARQDASVR